MPVFLIFVLVPRVELRLLVLLLADEYLFIDIFLFILLVILLNNYNGTSFLNILILLKVIPQEIVDIPQE